MSAAAPCRPTWAISPSAPAGLITSLAKTPVSRSAGNPPTMCTPTREGVVVAEARFELDGGETDEASDQADQ